MFHGYAEPNNACFIDRHGQTILLAIALTSKEGTADYEWQWDCYKDSVGIDPGIIFTDADPGVTAAIASRFPRTRHLWCWWHLYQNLRKKLFSVLGAERYSDFMKEFRQCQEQMSKSVFRIQYNKLKQDWPTTVPYLDEQLSANTQYWAAYAQDRFTTGAVSTQRGEGLNRHFKSCLSGQSPLSKVFEQVLLQEAKEEAKLVVATARDEVCSLLSLNMDTTPSQTLF
jgi:hypothetical protein